MTEAFSGKHALEKAVGKAAKWAKTAPIVQFYMYMWRRNKKLLALNVFTNYLIPVVTEILPWYFSVRRISKRIRLTKTNVEHALVLGKGLDGSRIASLAMMTVLYAILHNLLELLRNRNHLESQLLTRRLVMEKILFSEIGAVQRRYETVFGETVRPEDMEEHVFRDVSDTVILFEVTIPSIIRGVAELLRETYELYIQRENIDLVALARPFALNTLLEAINLARWRYIEDRQEQLRMRNRLRMAKAISNMCEGLSDVQVNNIQGYQLKVLDKLISREVEGRQGAVKYLNMVYETIDNRALIDFISETYVAYWVMRARGITHEVFTNIRNEILHVVLAGGRLWKQVKRAALVMDAQYRVTQLLDLEMFSNESEITAAARKPPQAFSRMVIHSVRFNYKREGGGAVEDSTLQVTPSDEKEWRTQKSLMKLPRRVYIGDPSEGSPLHDNRGDGKARARAASGDGDEEGASEDELSISRDHPPLVIEKGKTYLIVGRNRSGKSTLMKVLCQILRPRRMDIEWNGKAFRDIDRVSVRRTLSYVAQRPFIFEGTVAENIALGRNGGGSPSGQDLKSIEYAAEQAGVFISEHSSAGETGTRGAEPNELQRRRRLPYKPWARSPPFVEWLVSRAWSLATDISEHLKEALNSDPREDALLSVRDPLACPMVSASALIEMRKGDFHRRSTLSKMISESRLRTQYREESERKLSLGNICLDSAADLEEMVAGSNSKEGQDLAEKEEMEARKQAKKKEVLEMHTSTRGTNLSGGFAQSIALARVFLRPEAKIVMLDEALGQMDAIKRNAHVLPRLFKFVKENKQTLIMVSHDILSVAKQVDHIFVMDGGRCTQQGSHAELLQRRAPEYMQLISEVERASQR